MIRRYVLFYLAVITIPLFLLLAVWQSNRYQNLKKEIERLELAQTEWLESNKRLAAEIADNSSPQRIDKIARNLLYLHKIRPEDVLQIRIMEGNN
jgi:cell division protein FtsL